MGRYLAWEVSRTSRRPAFAEASKAGLCRLWYKTLYGLDTRKYPDETWSNWETRISDALGLTIIRINTLGQTVDEVGERIRLDFLPIIEALPVERCRPQPMPGRKWIFLFVKRYLAKKDIPTWEDVDSEW